MADSSPKRDPDPRSNARQDPGDRVTGEERMTGARASYLKTLCEEAKEPFEPGLMKAEASRRIDELQERTGRGRPAQGALGEGMLDKALEDSFPASDPPAATSKAIAGADPGDDRTGP